ncbi:MAG: uroporphyrinogen decarboxylase family protein [Candidatus Hodarchaeota archaeon]
MNSRQRVLSAINHRPLEDSFPIDLGGPISGISKIAYDRYLERYASHLYPSILCDRFQQLGCIHEEILKRWKVDTRHICVGFQSTDIDEYHYYDGFGVKYRGVFSPYYNKILYFDQIEWPLKDSRNIKDIESFNWPKIKEGKLEEVSKQVNELYNQNEHAIILDAPTGGILESCTWIVGLNAFFTDLYQHYDFFDYLIDKIAHNVFIPYWEETLRELGEYVDIVLIGDDFGMQDRMIISPRMFRELVKPRLRDVIITIKKSANVKVMLHSCGSIFPIIDDLIEIGFDILNPLQPQAKNMDHQKIKEKFGKKLCLHGGVDIQRVMPRSTQEEVQQEIQSVLTTLGVDKTGYILATAHNILADVPAENINAYISSPRIY